MTAQHDDRLTAATWGLFLAWAVHDAEELLTMAGWVERARPRLSARFPRVPERVWDGLRVTPAQAGIAVAAMGAIMATAAARGARTGGRSRFYQAALAGFGLHAVTHVGQAAALRGYTPGSVTAPLVVAPFSAWAWRQLGRADVRHPAGASVATAVALLPAATVACQTLARTLTRSR